MRAPRTVAIAALAIVACDDGDLRRAAPPDSAAEVTGDCAVSVDGLECLGVSSYAPDVETARREATAR
ncbi:MAG TPA: hypothetical protein VFU21_08255, partial [Kofleriaceae bacterium]|nr:hypothetical protein [Kofleriaceae bacterium]